MGTFQFWGKILSKLSILYFSLLSFSPALHAGVPPHYYDACSYHPPLRNHAIKELRQTKVPWASNPFPLLLLSDNNRIWYEHVRAL